MKPDPVIEKNGTEAWPATAGPQSLAGARWTCHEHTPRCDGPGGGVLLTPAEEIDHLGDIALDPLVSRDIGERRCWAVGVDHLRARLTDPGQAAQPPAQAAAGGSADVDEVAEEQQDRQERQQRAED